MAELTCTIELRRRSLFGRIFRAPFLWFSHYRMLRSGNGRLVSAFAAWYLASRVMVFK